MNYDLPKDMGPELKTSKFKFINAFGIFIYSESGEIDKYWQILLKNGESSVLSMLCLKRANIGILDEYSEVSQFNSSPIEFYDQNFSCYFSPNGVQNPALIFMKHW